MAGSHHRDPLAVTLKYDAILIDADDTIFDFYRAESHALEQTFADHEITIPVDSFVADFREINAAVWREYESGKASTETIRTKRFVQLLNLLGLAADPQSVSDRYIHHLSTAAFLVDGAIDFLEKIHGATPLVLLTNGLSGVQRPRFAAAGMERYFRAIVISEEVGVQKPDPAVFQIALLRAAEVGDRAANTPALPGGRIPPGRAIMIGDSLHSDIAGAIAAGIDACWFNLRGRENAHGIQPTFTVSSLAEIPPLLGL